MNRNSRTPTLPGIGLSLKLMSSLILIPFGWNQREGKLERRGKIVVGYWFMTGIVFPALHILSSIVILLKVVKHISEANAWDDVSKLLGFTLSVLLVLGNIKFTYYAVIMMRNYDAHIMYYNEMIRFRIQLKQAGANVRNDMSIFKALSVLILLRIYSGISLCISHPEKPLFLYWAIPDGWKSPIVHPAYVIFHSVFWLTFWTTLCFTLVTIFMFVETFEAAVEFRISQKDVRLTEDLRHYKELLVLSRLFDDAFGKDGLPLYFSFVTALLVFATYAVIRFYGRVIFQLYVSFLSPFLGINSALACLFPPAARMREKSIEFRMKMYQSIPSDRKQYKRAVLRSFPDLSLRADNYFTVQRKTHITFIGFALINAVTLLITL